MAKSGSPKRSFFDLRSQFIFYASYHNEPVNVGIHLFCIWQIVWSLLALLQYTPAFIATPAWITNASPVLEHVSVNMGLVVTTIYVVTYLMVDPVAGGLGAALMVGLFLGTGALVKTTPTLAGHPLWQLVLGYHVLMWILQFIGHGVFEKRAPALLDSWDQALLTAPLFVLLEILFYLGYRRQFHQECMVEVNKNIAKFKKSKST